MARCSTLAIWPSSRSGAVLLHRYPALGFDGTNCLAVWQDNRNKPGEPDIYGARVTPDGAVLDTSGFLISLSARGQYAPAVGFDGKNFLAVWEDDRDGYTDIYGARVTPGGTVLDPDGIAICTAQNNQYSPAIAFDGTNYLVAWEDCRSDTSGDIYGARVTPGGAVLDPNGVAISRCCGPAAVSGRGLCRRELPRGVGGLPQRRLGYLRHAGDARRHRAQYRRHRHLAVASYQQSILPSALTARTISWCGTIRATAPSYDIYGARVTPGGQVLDPAALPSARRRANSGPRACL